MQYDISEEQLARIAHAAGSRADNVMGLLRQCVKAQPKPKVKVKEKTDEG
jgi:hypothetical protein